MEFYIKLFWVRRCGGANEFKCFFLIIFRSHFCMCRLLIFSENKKLQVINHFVLQIQWIRKIKCINMYMSNSCRDMKVTHTKTNFLHSSVLLFKEGVQGALPLLHLIICI